MQDNLLVQHGETKTCASKVEKMQVVFQKGMPVRSQVVFFFAVTNAERNLKTSKPHYTNKCAGAYIVESGV